MATERWYFLYFSIVSVALAVLLSFQKPILPRTDSVLYSARDSEITPIELPTETPDSPRNPAEMVPLPEGEPTDLLEEEDHSNTAGYHKKGTELVVEAISTK